jgi:hypothetical protein
MHVLNLVLMQINLMLLTVVRLNHVFRLYGNKIKAIAKNQLVLGDFKKVFAKFQTYPPLSRLNFMRRYFR